MPMTEESERRRKILEESKYFTLTEQEMWQWLILRDEDQQAG